MSSKVKYVIRPIQILVLMLVSQAIRRVVCWGINIMPRRHGGCGDIYIYIYIYNTLVTFDHIVCPPPMDFLDLILNNLIILVSL